VIGFTNVDNTGGVGLTGGDTVTTINNSWLQGNGGPGPGFVLNNPNGKDIIDIQGNSQFGIGPFPNAAVAIDIQNRDGGSRTTFTGASPIAGFGTTTVWGDLNITNAVNVVGTLDVVTFNGTNVLGDVHVLNGNGDTSVVVNNSNLGSHLVAPPFSPVIGSECKVLNGDGYDQFSMNQSQCPWGLHINNDVNNAGNSLWGSRTTITSSQIGNHPFGPSIPGFPNAAMVLLGDGGADIVNVSSTTFGGTLHLNLFAGNNDVIVNNRSSMAAFYLITLGGNDTVLLDDITIVVVVNIDLGDGADTLLIRNIDPATEWPILGSVIINGGLGVDTTNLSALALGALGFENFVA
jgi:hypothetical protein